LELNLVEITRLADRSGPTISSTKKEPQKAQGAQEIAVSSVPLVLFVVSFLTSNSSGSTVELEEPRQECLLPDLRF
jgi:hypothetical protein